MRLITTTLLMSALALPVLAETRTYATDQGHTEVRFGWDHAGVSRQHGEFDRAEGKLSIDLDDPASASLEVTIDATSLSTGFGPLDDHVKNADFLEVDAHPTIRFTSSSVTRTGDTTADVTGDVVVRGVAVPTKLKVDLTHQGAHPLAQFIDYYKGDWLAFRATGEIDTSSLGFALPVGTLVVDISSELKAE